MSIHFLGFGMPTIPVIAPNVAPVPFTSIDSFQMSVPSPLVGEGRVRGIITSTAFAAANFFASAAEAYNIKDHLQTSSDPRVFLGIGLGIALGIFILANLALSKMWLSRRIQTVEETIADFRQRIDAIPVIDETKIKGERAIEIFEHRKRTIAKAVELLHQLEEKQKSTAAKNRWISFFRPFENGRLKKELGRSAYKIEIELNLWLDNIRLADTFLINLL